MMTNFNYQATETPDHDLIAWLELNGQNVNVQSERNNQEFSDFRDNTGYLGYKSRHWRD